MAGWAAGFGAVDLPLGSGVEADWPGAGFAAGLLVGAGGICFFAFAAGAGDIDFFAFAAGA
ncbi:MAG TPA: hypothetical protein PKA04_04350, partial [Marmoricola sp.]|nr:hypothetical protein [Marmoricola sp.]